jgi:hypothetical protein
MERDRGPTEDITVRRVTALLAEGEVELLGQVLSSSNVIFLARVDDGDLHTLAIYKPHRGETPLWDFPQGTLCQREVAAYLLAQALGWPAIPPTVLREGPYGPGSLQLYIDAVPEANYFTFGEERPEELMAVALFDVVTNNADRKGGHLLLDGAGRIWAIDHALTFHVEPKLRTVIWDFAGAPIPKTYLADLRRLQDALEAPTGPSAALDRLLSAQEGVALRDRLSQLVTRGTFPLPDPSRRQIPWPVI